MSTDIQRLAHLDKFLTWAQKNLRLIITGAIVICIIGLGIIWFNWHRSARENAASVALLSLRGHLHPQGRFTPNTPEEYLNIADTYKNTKAAPHALILAGSAYFTDGKYTNALAVFDRFLKEYPNHPLRNHALFGLALCYEMTGQTQTAIPLLEDLIRKYQNDPVIPLAKLALARIYSVTGKTDAALLLLRDVEKSEGLTLTGYRAEILLEKLMSSLTSTNALNTSTNK